GAIRKLREMRLRNSDDISDQKSLMYSGLRMCGLFPDHRRKRKMVGCRGGGEAGKYYTFGDTFGDLVGGEYEIEPYVRVPGREGEPLVIMQAAINVYIARV